MVHYKRMSIINMVLRTFDVDVDKSDVKIYHLIICIFLSFLFIDWYLRS